MPISQLLLPLILVNAVRDYFPVQTRKSPLDYLKVALSCQFAVIFGVDKGSPQDS